MFVFDGFVSCFSASVFGVLLFVNLRVGFFYDGFIKIPNGFYRAESASLKFCRRSSVGRAADL